MPTGSVNGLSDFTISAWVNRAATTGQTWARIFDVGNNTAQNMFLTVNAGGAGLRFAITTSGSGGEQQITAAPQLPTGWQHVAVSRSGTTGTLWLNGNPVATNTITISPSALRNSVNNWIGRSQYPDPLLNATVDDFNIFSRALSQADIQSLMAAPSGGDVGGGDVAWYTFDEEDGSTVLDASGNERHATVETPVIATTSPTSTRRCRPRSTRAPCVSIPRSTSRRRCTCACSTGSPGVQFVGGDNRLPNNNEFFFNWNPNTQTFGRSGIFHNILGAYNFMIIDDTPASGRGSTIGLSCGPSTLAGATSR